MSSSTVCQKLTQNRFLHFNKTVFNLFKPIDMQNSCLDFESEKIVPTPTKGLSKAQLDPCVKPLEVDRCSTTCCTSVQQQFHRSRKQVHTESVVPDHAGEASHLSNPERAILSSQSSLGNAGSVGFPDAASFERVSCSNVPSRC